MHAYAKICCVGGFKLGFKYVFTWADLVWKGTYKGLDGNLGLSSNHRVKFIFIHTHGLCCFHSNRSFCQKKGAIKKKKKKVVTHLTNFISSYFSISLCLLEQPVSLSFRVSLLSRSLYLPSSLRKLTITHVGWVSSACSYLKWPIFRPVCLQIRPCWVFVTFLINLTTIVLLQNYTYRTINQHFKNYHHHQWWLVV